MTPEELAADRAICDAATPGPWFVSDSIRKPEHYQLPDGSISLDDDNVPWVFAWGILVQNAKEGYSIVHGGGTHSVSDIIADIDFIAAARTRWPEALNEIETLRELRRFDHEDMDRMRAERILSAGMIILVSVVTSVATNLFWQYVLGS